MSFLEDWENEVTFGKNGFTKGQDEPQGNGGKLMRVVLTTDYFRFKTGASFEAEVISNQYYSHKFSSVT